MLTAGIIYFWYMTPLVGHEKQAYLFFATLLAGII